MTFSAVVIMGLTSAESRPAINRNIDGQFLAVRARLGLVFSGLTAGSNSFLGRIMPLMWKFRARATDFEPSSLVLGWVGRKTVCRADA